MNSFCLNGLALNPNKSESIWLSTQQRSRTLQPYPSINVAGADVPISGHNVGQQIDL